MDNVQKFQELLKELFQFETSDLDFGIYRILNYKRDQIKKFIQEDLVNKVESAFAKHKDERLTNINHRFEEAKEKIIQSLGKEAFTPTSELKEQFKDTPLGRDYLSIKAQKEEAKTIDEIKLQVFNDLFSFFSRFYYEGDFVPQYRYSIKGHKYAIPYNGEEVKLYWANNEQYYTKTGLLFRDYTFKTNNYKVIFRIVSAREELGSKKATKERFFILDDENPIEMLPSPLAGEGEGEGDIKDKTLIIRFQYRELTDKEVKHYEVESGSNTSKQEKINQKTYDEVLKKVKDVELRASLGKEYKPVLRKSEGTEKPILLYQISRFTAKNTKDHFIHKNLKKFLSEQLDYFIKAEVLSIETLEKEKYLDKHITRAKVVREIGEDIIDFLSQIEDFQKRLWEKKKFVLKTEYVITTDRVPEEFYDEIWKNKEQKKEWKELGFDIPKSKEDLKKKKLPIDTRYFNQGFKEKLLEKLTEGHPERSQGSLDDLLDGLLIKSENWQAMSLLLGKYRGKVKCIYIDPPYNTGSDDFLYRDRYQHSSWLTMIENRLSVAREWMINSGTLFISIDDNEMRHLLQVGEQVFSPECIAALLIAQTNPRGRTLDRYVAKTHEYIMVLVKTLHPDAIREIPKTEEHQAEYKEKDEEGRYRLLGLRNRNPMFNRGNRPNLFFPIYVDPQTGQVSLERTAKFSIEVFPRNRKGDDGCWTWGREKVEHEKPLLIAKQTRTGGWRIFRMDYLEKNGSIATTKIKSIWLDKSINHENGKETIGNLFGRAPYDFPKSVDLIAKCVQVGSDLHGLLFDFFAGSGTTAHAVMKLNKEDGGKRKYILVEMANYFDTVIIPRLKKICYSFNWKEGTPQDTDGISQFFKYQILEQYEDTLDNIELTPNETAQTLFKDDYLLKYYLDYETRGNPSLLNIEMLKNPFAYKLRVNLEEVGEPHEMVVDIPETFNYLLGLKVKRIKARTLKCHPELVSGSKGMLKQVQHDKHLKRKYLFILGEKEGKDIAIVWRDYEPSLRGDEGWSEDDFKKDKEFIIKELAPWTPHIVYVNGQSVLTPKLGETQVEIRHIEPEFKRLMEG